MPCIGILAYGSLITDPGYEIASAANLDDSGELQKVQFETSFNVEYARLSKSRNEAPTLVPVPSDIGSRVNGTIIGLRSKVTMQDAMDILYRRELDRVGDLSRGYDDGAQRKKDDAVVIDRIEDHTEFDVLIYAFLKPTPVLLAVLRDSNLSTASKGQHLAQAAYSSLN